MVDNRYATALVIGSVLSLLATVYLSVAVGTQYWYQYSTPPVKHDGSNATELRAKFIDGEFDEKTYSDTMFRLNGTLGLWWRCILVPSSSMWFKTPGMDFFTNYEIFSSSFILVNEFYLINPTSLDTSSFTDSC